MSNELYHHGIKGQKWGIRRFQNKDGTLTAQGRNRYNEDSDGAQNGSPKRTINKATVAKGAAVVGAVALGAVLITNPGARNVLAKYGNTAIRGLGRAVGTGAAKTVNFGGRVAKKTSERLDKAADAMVDAALVSVGGIAVSKVTEKLAVDENASEAEKNRSKVLTDTVTAGIKTATGSGSNNSSGNSNKGGSVGKEVSEKIGAPSKKGIDKQSKEYQDLFKGQDADTRATIKSLAGAGYDIDQINKYLGHADFEDWASQYMAVEIGW